MEYLGTWSWRFLALAAGPALVLALLNFVPPPSPAPRRRAGPTGAAAREVRRRAAYEPL